MKLSFHELTTEKPNFSKKQAQEYYLTGVLFIHLSRSIFNFQELQGLFSSTGLLLLI